MEVSSTRDIIIKRVAFLGCPMATAYHLAKGITRYLQRSEEGMLPQSIDIPINTRTKSNLCIAFVRLQNPNTNEKFLAACGQNKRTNIQMLQPMLSLPNDSK